MAEFNRKDNDGHKYNIPYNELDTFDLYMKCINYAKWGSEMWHLNHANLNNRFGQYMVG